MKKLVFLSLLLILALLLSSCQLHTGLGKLFNGGGSSSSGTSTKHVKATHTPPSPPTATGSTAVTATPTP